jgi:lipoprotein-anchoring transpeptidase ErfK/SrfK
MSKEKNRAASERYRKKHRELIRLKAAKYRREHPDKVKKAIQKFREQNPQYESHNKNVKERFVTKDQVTKLMSHIEVPRLYGVHIAEVGKITHQISNDDYYCKWTISGCSQFYTNFKTGRFTIRVGRTPRAFTFTCRLSTETVSCVDRHLDILKATIMAR